MPFEQIDCPNCGKLLDYTTCIDCELVIPFCRECGYAYGHENHRLMTYESDKTKEK